MKVTEGAQVIFLQLHNGNTVMVKGREEHEDEGTARFQCWTMCLWAAWSTWGKAYQMQSLLQAEGFFVVAIKITTSHLYCH